MKELKELLNKRFSVYVDGEFESYANFLGVMKRLSNFSDFFEDSFSYGSLVFYFIRASGFKAEIGTNVFDFI